MEIRDRDNNLLYGCPKRPLPRGYLPQNMDIDLCVEYYIYQGFKEKVAIEKTAEDVIIKYNLLTESEIIKKSIIVARIRKLRDRRRKRLKELSVDKRTGEERLTGRGIIKYPHPSKLVFSKISKDIFNCITCVAKSDLPFIEDQEGPRNIRLSENSRPEPILEAQEAEASGSSTSREERLESQEDTLEEDDSEDLDKEPVDPDYVQPSKKRLGKSVNSQLLEIADRYGLSAEATAQVHNLYSDQSYTKEGMRKNRIRARKKAAFPDFSHLVITGIGFDERKDFSLNERGDIRREEHCSVVLYESSGSPTFAGHFTPVNGTSVALADGLYQFCTERGINLDNLLAIVTDGTHGVPVRLKWQSQKT